MEHVTQNLTEGKLARQIFLFSVPLMISNLLQALFNMADIMVVGQFVGRKHWVPSARRRFW